MYTCPDRWVVIKVTMNQQKYYKIFASWFSSYLSGESWRMNSGIETIHEDDEYYYFHGKSGSIYQCHKKMYGVAGSYSNGTLFDIIENAKHVDANIELLENKTDWMGMKYV